MEIQLRMPEIRAENVCFSYRQVKRMITECTRSLQTQTTIMTSRFLRMLQVVHQHEILSRKFDFQRQSSKRKVQVQSTSGHYQASVLDVDLCFS